MESQFAACDTLSRLGYMCSSPGGSVYVAARDTNVCVRRQACVGLGGFLISCPITSVHLLKEDVSLSRDTVRSAHMHPNLSLFGLRILCLGSLAGYLGEEQ